MHPKLSSAAAGHEQRQPARLQAIMWHSSATLIFTDMIDSLKKSASQPCETRLSFCVTFTHPSEFNAALGQSTLKLAACIRQAAYTNAPHETQRAADSTSRHVPLECIMTSAENCSCCRTCTCRCEKRGRVCSHRSHRPQGGDGRLHEHCRHRC